MMVGAEVFAIGSAMFFAMSNISVKFGLNRHGSPFSALVAVGSGTVAMWLIVALFGFAVPNTIEALFLFAVRGLLDPGLSALLIFLAIRKIGVSVTIPILAAAPFVSTTLSVLFLNEPLTLFVILGTLLIIAGVTLLSYRKGHFGDNIKFILLAIIASASIGLAVFITKLALNVSNTPIGGLSVSFVAGLMLLLAVMVALRKWNEVPLNWDSSRFFILGGVLVAGAFSFTFLAVANGLVSVVLPLIGTQPLFTLVLSFLLLRQHENITRNVILGTVVIVAGAALLVF
jgi:drug/metabolite transporter, DME family